MGVAVLCLLCTAALTVPVAGLQSAQPAERDALARELARLEQSATQLARQLELAQGNEFYLRLDPLEPDLALMLRGAELQRYPILGLQVGRPRVSWLRRGGRLGWQGAIWAAGALDPPRQLDRLVIQADSSGGGEAEEPKPPVIPPTAEELYQIPSRYHIRFAGGLSIEVRPHEADASVGLAARLGAMWAAKWRDVAAALAGSDADAVRLRVVLAPDDAASLYRALPPSTKLIVLAGPGAGGAPTDPPGR